MAIVFIGPPAAGKTTYGRVAAGVLGLDFIDTDCEFERFYGPIPEFFRRESEISFRRLEREQILIALNKRALVATGAGAVLQAKTRADLARHTVVYLSTTALAAAKYLGQNRPLSSDVAAWQKLYDQRRTLYEALADITIETSVQTPEVGEEIVRKLKEGFSREIQALGGRV